MPVYKNKTCGVDIELVHGKLYVVDQFSGPCSGPFNSEAEAEADRKGTNIEEDCFIGECRQVNNRFIISGVGVAASAEVDDEEAN